VPAEELLDGALLAVLALLALALPAADLLPLAVRVPVVPRPELALARDPGLSLAPAVLAGVLAVERADVDREEVPLAAVVPDADRPVRAPWARVLLLAGVVLAADVVAAVAVDIFLAASVSDLTADSIALVAVLIDFSAVAIVRAEVVALPAAEFSLVAAFVAFVAAADTARGVGADLAVPRLVALRLPLVLLPPERLLLVRLLAVRLLVVRPADALVALALAVVDLVVRFAVSVGTDLSPRS
jgi:hypothetical protein